MKHEAWTTEMEAANLRELFSGIKNKAEFARQHKVPGGPSMLSQHLSGNRPISGMAAVAYARGLKVPLDRISPRFAALVDIANQAIEADAVGTMSLDVQEVEADYLPGFKDLSIPVLANSGSMGDGDDQLHEEVVIGRITVSPDWAMRTLKPTGLEALRFIHGYGDSMHPTFADGDVLLVDVGVQECKVDGVYVLEANDRLYIKRVRQRMDGSFEISSDNPTVKTVDVLDGSRPVGIRGRVLWAWNGRKL